MKQIKLASRENCSGCLACYNACPCNAITLSTDDEGFVRPLIIKERCIGCKSCENVCFPICEKKELRIEPLFQQKVIAAWSKSKKTRRKSSSGGLFAELAKIILEKRGVVYGAAFSKNNKVIHQRIETKNELYLLQGSKYVQSFINYSLKMVKEDLNKGRYVLFSGTPCQIKGLFLYLQGTPIDKLFTVDLVCHGVPSPKVLNDYLNYLESKFNTKIVEKSISFRDKKYSWVEYNMLVKFENGKKYISMSHSDPFLRGFLRQYFLRPSCHKCFFANSNRTADITLGDYWCYKSDGIKDYNNDKGISMVVVNTNKGSKLIDSVKNIKKFERTMENAISTTYTFQRPFEPNENREEFWNDYAKYGFDFIVDKYLFPDKLSQWSINKMNAKKFFYKTKYFIKTIAKRMKS